VKWRASDNENEVSKRRPHHMNDGDGHGHYGGGEYKDGPISIYTWSTTPP
jgi:hypothetical protein